MAIYIVDRFIVGDEIFFKAEKDGKIYKFRVSREALKEFASWSPGAESFDPTAVFWEANDQIKLIAEKLIAKNYPTDADGAYLIKPNDFD